jgi:hypothetical protein
VLDIGRDAVQACGKRVRPWGRLGGGTRHGTNCA